MREPGSADGATSRAAAAALHLSDHFLVDARAAGEYAVCILAKRNQFSFCRCLPDDQIPTQRIYGAGFLVDVWEAMIGDYDFHGARDLQALPDELKCNALASPPGVPTSVNEQRLAGYEIRSGTAEKNGGANQIRRLGEVAELDSPKKSLRAGGILLHVHASVVTKCGTGSDGVDAHAERSPLGG